MKKELKELQRLKGVGEVLSRRFVEVGFDSFTKIAAAGEEGIKKIKGINPRMVGAIVTQAGEMAGEADGSREKRIGELERKAAELKGEIEKVALGVRNRFREEVSGKAGRKVAKELIKVVASLEKAEEKFGSKMKRAEKGLARAEKRLAAITDAGLKGVGKGLKKARKSLRNIYE